MDQMLSRLNNKKMDETTFIKPDWEQFKRIDEVFPCVKKLTEQDKPSDQDTYDEWDVSVFLPVQAIPEGNEACLERLHKWSEDNVR